MDNKMSKDATARDEPNSRYLEDWYGQPASLIRSAHALDRQWPAMREAGRRLRRSTPLLLTGMGSSFNAVLTLEAFLAGCGLVAKAVDTSELIYNHPLPAGAAVVAASRSGESVELVKLSEVCRAQDVPLVAVTNGADSALARQADTVVDLQTDFDHLISLRMYTAVVQGLLALGQAICRPQAGFPLEMLVDAWQAVAERMDGWRSAVDESGFFGPGHVYYCLGRAGSWASANETRIKLEEGGKTGAGALLTGAFRHGPQEIIGPHFRGILWIPENEPLRTYDLALAESIQAGGGRCLLVGRNLQTAAGGLVVELPPIPAPFRPVIDAVPVQIGGYLHARATGRNPDEFVFCSYIVTTEGGL
jgi:glutamine---fructose-6-phosphate transaminase (isomerizing)